MHLRRWTWWWCCWSKQTCGKNYNSTSTDRGGNWVRLVAHGRASSICCVRAIRITAQLETCTLCCMLFLRALSFLLLFSRFYLRTLQPRPSLSSFVEAAGLQFEREVLRKGVLLKYNAIITVTVTQLYRLAKAGDVATVGCSLPYFNT